MTDRTASISKVYISGGEENPHEPAGMLRDATSQLLVAGGMELMPQVLREEIAEHLLQFVDLKKIDEAEAYVFLGKLDPVSLYLLYFLADRAQSNMPDAMIRNADGSLRAGDKEGHGLQKPIVLINANGEYDLLIARLEALMFHGGAKRHFSEVIKVVNTPQEAHEHLRANNIRSAQVFTPKHEEHVQIEGRKSRGDPPLPKIFVCCGFSIAPNDYLDAVTDETARLLAKDYDGITGGGRGGLMKRFQKAAFDAGMHITGITFPTLNVLANEPGKGSETFGISNLRAVKNMSKRMEKMIARASGLLVLPGGVGTDNETIGPILMKVLGAIDEGVPVVLQNIVNPVKGGRYHDTLVALLEDCGLEKGRDFHVVEPPLIYDNAGALDVSASATLAAEMTRAAFREHIKPAPAYSLSRG